MVSWIYNNYESPKKVQCPECGHEMISRREYAQCSVKGCRHRFVAGDHLYKTSDDIFKEHREIHEHLGKVKSVLRDQVKIIETLQQKLKPLNKPKLKENKPKPIQQTVTQ